MHVAVTGASSGIGEAIALEFAAAGHAVTLVARRRDRLERIAAACQGGRALALPWDLGDPRTATGWIAQAEAVHGPIDVLVNNAGVQIVGPTAETDPEHGEAVIATDLLTPLRLTRAVLPAMLARKSGILVDVASMAAIAPTPGMTWYNAAKAGLAAASEAMRGELRGTGVHVVTVYPGIIPTDMGSKAMDSYGGAKARAMALTPQGNTQELARRIRRAVERRQARVIYPSSMVFARWLPGPTRWVMDRFTPVPKLQPLPTAPDGAARNSG